jgi:hypothetical protein
MRVRFSLIWDYEMNWKELINQWTFTIHIPSNPPRLVTTKLDPKFLENFISTEIIEALIADMEEYLEHSRDCILSYYEAGRPTPEGGYEQKIKGKWYQSRPVDKIPKCDCGLEQLRDKWL